MPKFPPPPRRPQNKPAFVPALAVTISPSAVMTSQERTLSQVRPYLRTSHPPPPPRVRPAMPVFETTPVGTAKPCGWVSRSTSPSSAPAHRHQAVVGLDHSEAADIVVFGKVTDRRPFGARPQVAIADLPL